MKRTKIMAAVCVVVLMLTIATNALANIGALGFYGNAKMAFTSNDYVEKQTNETWSSFVVSCNMLTYSGTQFTYFYTRAYTSTGNLGSNQDTVSLANPRTLTPTIVGAAANRNHCRVVNADYEENGVKTNNMFVNGNMRGYWS